MTIRLERGVHGMFLLVADGGRDILIQSEWDFPGTASSFGSEACSCGRTDGAVDCEHRTRSEMMAEAWDSLASHIDMTIEDPGYF